MSLGIASVAAITALCFFVGELIKRTPLNNKWIPIFAGGTGIILGIVAFLIKIPDMPATDIINAAAIGLMSGLAATGANQIYKQLTKN